VNLYLQLWIESGRRASFALLAEYRRRKLLISHLTHSHGLVAGWEHSDSQWFIVKKHNARASLWFFAAYDHFSVNFTKFHTISQLQDPDFSPVTRFSPVNLNRGRNKRKNVKNEVGRMNNNDSNASEGIPLPGGRSSARRRSDSLDKTRWRTESWSQLRISSENVG
jgi:hypothetical protein